MRCVAQLEQITMGVVGATKLLGDGTLSDLMDLNKPSIAIDAMHIIFQLSKGHLAAFSPILNRSSESMTSCYKILEFIMAWYDRYVIQPYTRNRGKSNCVVPIFVFDGHSSGAKKKTIKKRKDRQQSAVNTLESIFKTRVGNFSKINMLDLSNHSNRCIENTLDTRRKHLESAHGFDKNLRYKDLYLRNMRDSYNPTNEIGYVKLMLGFLGVPFIEAPTEGDAQCAALSAKYQVGTITGDMDIMLLGCPTIYKLISVRKLNLEAYDLKSVLRDMSNRVEKIQELDRSIVLGSDHMFRLVDLRSVCCLMGTDYCAGIRIDQNKLSIDSILWLYYKNNQDLLKVLLDLRDNRDIRIRQMVKLNLHPSSGLRKLKPYRSGSSSNKRDSAYQITDSYISQMLEAFNQYNKEKVLDLPETVFRLDRPDAVQLTGFLSSFLNRESVDKAVRLSQEAYECFRKNHGYCAKFDFDPDKNQNVNDLSVDSCAKPRPYRLDIDLSLQPRYIEQLEQLDRSDQLDQPGPICGC